MRPGQSWRVFLRLAALIWALAAVSVRADVRTLAVDNLAIGQPVTLIWSTNLLWLPFGHSDVMLDLPEVVTFGLTNGTTLTVDLGSYSEADLSLGCDSSGNLNLLWIGTTKSDFDWFLYGFVFAGAWALFGLALRIFRQVGHQSPEV